jgi:hypothetical protein
MTTQCTWLQGLCCKRNDFAMYSSTFILEYWSTTVHAFCLHTIQHIVQLLNKPLDVVGTHFDHMTVKAIKTK